MAESRDYWISLLDEVNFSPASEAEEVIQNVRTIISTVIGSVPLDRDFGLSWKYIDKPIQVSKMLFHADVINALELYEPRAVVTAIEYGDSTLDLMDGSIHPRIKIRLDSSVSTNRTDADYLNSQANGSNSSVERIYANSTVESTSSEATTLLSAQINDLEARLQDIERSDYTELYENGEV